MKILKISSILLSTLLLSSCSSNEKSHSEALRIESVEIGNDAFQETETKDLEKISVSEDEYVESYNFTNSNNSSASLNSTGNNKDWKPDDKNFKQKKKAHKKVISSETLSNPFQDKQFIKTSDLKFRVEDVYLSSVNIENIIIANDGFLLNSNLQTEIINNTIKPKNEDLNLSIESFYTRNNITLRVPSENLHTTLLKIADEITFLDYRIINADDIGLNLLAEELKQKRLSRSSNSLNNEVQKGGKLEDRIRAKQLIFEKEKQKDISKINTLTIADKVKYSTVTINIYGKEEFHVTEVVNTSKFEYQEPVLSKIVNSVQYGFEMFLSLIFVMLSIWPFILVALVLILFLKRYKSKK